MDPPASLKKPVCGLWVKKLFEAQVPGTFRGLQISDFLQYELTFHSQQFKDPRKRCWSLCGRKVMLHCMFAEDIPIDIASFPVGWSRKRFILNDVVADSDTVNSISITCNCIEMSSKTCSKRACAQSSTSYSRNSWAHYCGSLPQINVLLSGLFSTWKALKVWEQVIGAYCSCAISE